MVETTIFYFKNRGLQEELQELGNVQKESVSTHVHKGGVKHFVRFPCFSSHIEASWGVFHKSEA